jgi:hypothetical protein
MLDFGIGAKTNVGYGQFTDAKKAVKVYFMTIRSLTD